ncbi:hypothetical protein E2C01_039124 [Portunus trituberculatus]|uniref:Uncharacterized protein n=1 Tax=Portunus trituberculatus TaxID=210409 RepID=A0A5B7FIS6_PORTR|nr:hypothetical protein [Portunus trituberculatus]
MEQNKKLIPENHQAQLQRHKNDKTGFCLYNPTPLQSSFVFLCGPAHPRQPNKRGVKGWYVHSDGHHNLSPKGGHVLLPAPPSLMERAVVVYPAGFLCPVSAASASSN